MSQNAPNCDHTHDLIPDRVFKIGITLNFVFVLVEIYYGISSRSLALVSDAFHNLTDVFSLLLAWLGYYLSAFPRGKKFSIYAALVNSALLLVGSAYVIKEAIERYQSEQQPVAVTMIVVAFLGFVINLTSAKLFHKDHHHDLNIRSAYLHLMADAAISLGVVLAGIIIYFKDLFWIDPVLSIVISFVIIYSTWSVFRQSVRMLLGHHPEQVDLDAVKEAILQAGVSEIMEIKVQSISTAENSLTARLQPLPNDEQQTKLRKKLKHDFRITKANFY